MWNVEQDDEDIYRTTTGNGALPSGNTLSNIYGRCPGISGNSYVLQAKDYSGNGLAPWPTNGTTGLTEKLYNEVKPNINCTPAISSTPCQPLKVVAVSACEGKTNNLATYCQNTPWSDIKWGIGIQNDDATNTHTPAGCYFVNITTPLQNDKLDIQTTSGTPAINGVSNISFSVSSLSSKKDNGYYIYLPSPTHYVDNLSHIYALEKPFCASGIHRLFCKGMPAQALEKKLITKPTLTCNDGSTASNESWPSVPNWTSPDVGDYNNVSVSATCGTSGTLTANCGNLKVFGASTNTCEIGGKLLTVCPNVTYENWKTTIKWDRQSVEDVTKAGCYYIASFGSLNAVSYMVNGKYYYGYNEFSKIKDEVDKLDNGYYIYVPNGQTWGSYGGFVVGTKPTCAL
jgi:hypothetical protein